MVGESGTVMGRLTPTGICYEQSAAPGCCCARKRRVELSYADILAIEQFQTSHYLVKYLNTKAQPRKVDEILIKIKDSTVAGRGSTDNIALLGGADGPPGPTPGPGDGLDVEGVEKFVLAKAYARARDPRTRQTALVIINPKSGPGEAEKTYRERAAPVFAAAGLRTEIVVTKQGGEATKIARELPMSQYDTFILVSGDGLPHEVLNGLATRGPQARAALSHFGISQLPGGSGNALSLALNNGERDWAQLALNIVKGQPEPHDIMAVTQGNQTYYSFLSQSYGIVADCDLGTENLRWMGGSRFAVGLVYKLLRNQTYPCEVAYKEGSADPLSSDDTLLPALTINDPVPSDWTVREMKNLTMFYVGKMDWMSADALMFPMADPLDGSMDMIMWDSSFGSANSMNAFLSVEHGDHVKKIPFYKKVQAYRLTPLVSDKYLSIDGESYPLKPFQVTVLRGVARFIR